MNISVRSTQRNDVEALCALLNEIIEIGGTTANERPMTRESFADKYIDGVKRLACHSAVFGGELVGFQFLGRNDDLADDWADIATFARATDKVRGVGTALFNATLDEVARHDVAVINARIRADNTGGLAYYDKMGFTTYAIDEAIPLADGTPVDRVMKKLELPAR